MNKSKVLFDFNWDVDKYKSNYDSDYWDLCRTFMELHKTKYPEQKLVHLTEAFFQIGVYGSSYDPKTTRMVSALSVDVLDDFLKLHPGAIKHPFNHSGELETISLIGSSVHDGSPEGKGNSKAPSKSGQRTSIWDVSVDKNIIVNILPKEQLEALFKGFVNIYDIRTASTMNDNKISILEESFKRSKFGPIHWVKESTNNNICPLRLSLKWKSTMLAEAEGSDEKVLRLRLAQALLSKLAAFSSGVEAKWSYYRDGRSHLFDNPNPRKSSIYRVLRKSLLKTMAEILTFIDTFANSDTFAEIVFGLDFSDHDKKQIVEYVTKTWGTKLTYRTVKKGGALNKDDSHICVYHLRTGEEIRQWVYRCDGEENDRYRVVPPGEHRRAGSCDSNVREVLSTPTQSVVTPAPPLPKPQPPVQPPPPPPETSQPKGSKDLNVSNKENKPKEIKVKNETSKEKENNSKREKESEKPSVTSEKLNKEKEVAAIKSEIKSDSDLENVLGGFVLFYDANKNSEIDKDDWFNALCESFKISKFGPLNIVTESTRPLRTRCTFKWNNTMLASAEGLTETQAKTAATLQLISKLEPFTYIIQAKEEYFYGGKVPPFMESPDPEKNEAFRVVRRKDLPSYYSIFQTIDEFTNNHSYTEMVFGADFTWELKNEIVVYLEAKNLDYRYFTPNNENPPTYMAVYHTVNPEELKKHLLKNGGENEKYKLIPPPKAELISETATEVEKPKVSEKVPEKNAEKPSQKPTPKSTVEPPVKPAEKPTAKTSEKPNAKPPEKPAVKSAEKPTAKPAEKPPLAKLADKRKLPETEVPLPELDNKIQIKLKKFKKDAVEYPEDTGGDFPGLILWVGIKKNSMWQRNLFCILLESFKMSKYGDLTVEESEENVWGRKEPLKKVVMKNNRKVLSVGLGESKTEAKNSASLQVLRQLRKHCYTIQAKESYFKEGKATPYDFNPDPAKDHVYRLARKEKFKDRPSFIKFVDEFAKNPCSGEVIFGDDFTYEEREFVLDHCRKINLNYRLMKCQSASKNMHTHIALYHQQPLPAIKAALIKDGGENDMYRLIMPGGKITNQASDNELWPESVDTGKEEASVNKKPTTDKASSGSGQVNGELNTTVSRTNSTTPVQNSKPNVPPTNTNKASAKPVPIACSTGKEQGDSKPIPVHLRGMNPQSMQPINTDASSLGANQLQMVQLYPQDMPLDGVPYVPSDGVPFLPQPFNFLQIYPQGPALNDPIIPGPAMQGPMMQDVGFGLQPYSFPGQPYQDVPLVFGPQPLSQQVMYGPVNMPMQPANVPMLNETFSTQSPVGDRIVFNSEGDKLNVVDLREELAKKRQSEGVLKETLDRKVYDMTPERKMAKENDIDNWSRKVFVSETEGNKGKPKGKPDDLREKLRQKDVSKDQRQKGGPQERRTSAEKSFSPGRSRKISPGRNRRRLSSEKEHHRFSPDRKARRFSPVRNRQNQNQRFSPGRERRISPVRNRQRFSPKRGNQRVSPERGRPRDFSRERVWEDTRIVRVQGSSFDNESPRGFDSHRDRDYPIDRLIFRKSLSRSPRRSPIPFRDNAANYRSRSPRLRRSASPPRRRDLWDNIVARYSESIFMYKYIKQDSTAEADPFALLRATRSLNFNVDFEFVTHQLSIDEWQVCVELVTDDSDMHPLVGEGIAPTEVEARLIAAHHAVDTVQKACRVIQPNYNYFAEGGVPEFINRKYPMKTPVYEIIQNLDPTQPVDRYTVDIMLQVFTNSNLEDIFFLACDFSFMERVLIIDVANQHNLWWRLFGPRHPDARPDDVVSTQHICISKQKSALQLIRELLANGGSTEKYTLVDPRESRITMPRDWHKQGHGFRH